MSWQGTARGGHDALLACGTTPGRSLLGVLCVALLAATCGPAPLAHGHAVPMAVPGRALALLHGHAHPLSFVAKGGRRAILEMSGVEAPMRRKVRATVRSMPCLGVLGARGLLAPASASPHARMAEVAEVAEGGHGVLGLL